MSDMDTCWTSNTLSIRCVGVTLKKKLKFLFYYMKKVELNHVGLGLGAA